MDTESGCSVSLSRKNGYLWFTLPGDINHDTINDVEQSILGQLSDEKEDVVLDCSRIEYLYSSGIGMLIRINKRIMAGGGKTYFVNCSPNIIQFFKDTRLDQIFPIFSNEVEFEIQNDDLWERKLSEMKKGKPLFIAQVEEGIYRINMSGSLIKGSDISAMSGFDPDPDIKVYVCDLSNIDNIDTSGIGALIGFQKKISDIGGNLILYGLQEDIQDIIQTFLLETDIEILNDEKDALDKAKKL